MVVGVLVIVMAVDLMVEVAGTAVVAGLDGVFIVVDVGVEEEVADRVVDETVIVVVVVSSVVVVNGVAVTVYNDKRDRIEQTYCPIVIYT